MSAIVPRFGNCETIALRAIPTFGMEEFRSRTISAIVDGARIAAFFGRPGAGDEILLTVVLVHGDTGNLSALSTAVRGEYPALTPVCPQAHWFEREISEQWGVIPQGHPWLKPIRFHKSYVEGKDAWGRDPKAEILPSVTDFFRLEGEQAHEVAVGPVHAGVIEPGHFRFQCFGEEVAHLEISLGYQHRGIEQALPGCGGRKRMALIETMAGDTTVAHSTAFCQAIEALRGGTAPARAEVIRGIALELERMANHTGDLGALAGDVGYLPTMSYCGRLRGDLLNMTALLCGNRFGRGLVCPGGVRYDLDRSRADELIARLTNTMRDIESATELLWTTPSVLGRFEETGTVLREDAVQLGLVGVAARACGIERDSRFEIPSGVFLTSQMPVATWTSGDVFARAWVRWLEIEYSSAFIREQLSMLPEGALCDDVPELEPDAMAVSIVEGWRGEVCHVVMTDSRGEVARVKVVDPSFHNWQGLAMSLRNQQISDFPLCNKSFNLSYCGHDL
ncbi:MAG: NADH-quinone oxidoreductase subunit C [Candidatus Brocadiia bacterium]